MKDIIKKLYLEDKKSQRQIAIILNLNQTRIKRLMKKYNISARTLSESQKVNELNPFKTMTEDRRLKISKALIGNTNAKGRIVSQETRDKISNAQVITGESRNSKKYRGLAKKYLKQECIKCGATKQLCVHHKDFNHFNSNLDNLEMMCISCHVSLHRNSSSIHF